MRPFFHDTTMQINFRRLFFEQMICQTLMLLHPDLVYTVRSWYITSRDAPLQLRDNKAPLRLEQTLQQQTIFSLHLIGLIYGPKTYSSSVHTSQCIGHSLLCFKPITCYIILRFACIRSTLDYNSSQEQTDSDLFLDRSPRCHCTRDFDLAGCCFLCHTPSDF